MMRHSAPLLMAPALLALLPAAACNLGGSVSGARGNAEFSYTNCLTECGPNARAIAAGGARATIVAITKMPVASAISSDPSVLAISPTPSTHGDGNFYLEVLSGRPGSVRMTLLDDSDREIDHVKLRVEATESIDFTPGWTGQRPLIIAGESYSLHATTLGRGGVTLVGQGALAFEYSSNLEGAPAGVFGDTAGFRALFPGRGTVTIRAGWLTKQIDVDIVAPESLDPIRMLTNQITIAKGRSLETPYTLTFGDKPVFGGCRWTSTDVRVAMVFDRSIHELSQAPHNTIDLMGQSAGSALASCTLGGRTVWTSIIVTP